MGGGTDLTTTPTRPRGCPQAQHGIDKIMEDGHVEDEEVTALYDKLELAMQASVARDDARKSAQVQQGTPKPPPLSKQAKQSRKGKAA